MAGTAPHRFCVPGEADSEVMGETHMADRILHFNRLHNVSISQVVLGLMAAKSQTPPWASPVNSPRPQLGSPAAQRDCGPASEHGVRRLSTGSRDAAGTRGGGRGRGWGRRPSPHRSLAILHWDPLGARPRASPDCRRPGYRCEA